MLLAQVLVEARRERAAENRVEHEEREIIGRRPRDADRTDADLRLLGRRHVDEGDLSGRELGRRGHGCPGTGAAFGHFPNVSSSSGRTPAAVTSPATISVAFDGRYRAA